MNSDADNILRELRKLQEQVQIISRDQKEMKKEMKMIFSDLAHFEGMVLKVMDHSASLMSPNLFTKKDLQH
ncbi:MAG: hypothetical protein H7A33_08110 [Deltaproteobacteria bacterium]|nr:hypothetical protein [Deltaproteobacteria bacterium]